MLIFKIIFLISLILFAKIGHVALISMFWGEVKL